jgi:hypothetical protein
MSNLQPLFASAPRLKLYINQGLVAYAIGFNFRVSVTVQPVFAIGSFEPVSLEPTMYNTVTGTIQIVRLLSPNTLTSLRKGSDGGGQDEITSISTPSSNIIQNSGVGGDATLSGTLESVAPGGAVSGVTNNPIAQSALFNHVSPQQLLLSKAFDMHLFMKLPTAAGMAKNGVGFNATTDLEEVAWMAINTCRITSRNTNIAMGQLVNEPLNFQGLLALHSQDDATKQFTLDNGVVQSNG